MPKKKSHKATRKRVTVTATGKVLVHPTGARHLMSGKSSKSRRHMRRARPLKRTDAARARKGL
ncbi:MAG TPA: bL35 family ribosomal protein [Planctomycetota bacterium]|nr:bL35 family ribosomal protein [Planctomycetota bacterium]